MRNVTLSIDEETYRRARIRAAEMDTSISSLVRDYLRELATDHDSESRFARLRRLQDETLEAIRARGGGIRSADNLTRDELYGRRAPR